MNTLKVLHLQEKNQMKEECLKLSPVSCLTKLNEKKNSPTSGLAMEANISDANNSIFTFSPQITCEKKDSELYFSFGQIDFVQSYVKSISNDNSPREGISRQRSPLIQKPTIILPVIKRRNSQSAQKNRQYSEQVRYCNKNFARFKNLFLD